MILSHNFDFGNNAIPISTQLSWQSFRPCWTTPILMLHYTSKPSRSWVKHLLISSTMWPYGLEQTEIRTCGATISLQLMMKWLLLFQVMDQKNGLITETFFLDSMVDNCAASATCIHPMLLCIMLSSSLMVKMAGHTDIPAHHSAAGRRRAPNVSEMCYHAYRLHPKPGEQPSLFWGGNLLQQYVVDAWASIEQSKLNWIRNHQKELKQTSLAIWDEIPMQHKHAPNAVDRTIRDLFHKNNNPFGGITMLFGGDFRQTLPIIQRGNREQIIAASIRRSRLWQHVTVHPLASQYATWQNSWKTWHMLPGSWTLEQAEQLMKLKP